MITGGFLVACSVTRNKSKETYDKSLIPDSENILESVKRQNLTGRGFYIQKAEIELKTQNGKEKFIGTVKYEYPGKYLISIKSRTGIEGARIYISGDSILVNDRINKKLYIGNSLYFKRKFGLNQYFIPLIFGDILEDKSNEDAKEKCSGDKLNIYSVVKGVTLNYNIDCKKRKTIVVNQVKDSVEHGIRIKNDKFFNIGSILVPGIIEFEESQSNTIVRIKIIRAEAPWAGSVKFIPGKDYELIELL